MPKTKTETLSDPPPDLSDWIQETVIQRAATLGLTAYKVAQATGGAVSEEHVRNYLQRRKSMGSHKLQHVLDALGLAIAPPTTPHTRPPTTRL
jgi:hypothetical protein